MISPGSKGWIRKYFSIVKNYQTNLVQFPGIRSEEELLYGYLQPTGIMYGYPTTLLFIENEQIIEWTSEEKFKVLLLEGLILVDHVQKKDFSLELIEHSLEQFVQFYEHTEIEKAKKSWLNFKGLDVYEKLESIISQRVDLKASFSHKLWTSYLYNSLIFQDLLLYYEYSGITDAEVVRSKREAIMLDMIKVISVAAHADGELAEEEEAIFDVFMASADLDSEKRDIAKSFWEEGRGIDEIEFNYERSWLLNRYILELAVLTVWSDKEVVEEELIFLDELTARLEIDHDEKDKSFLAIQTFVMNNHESVPFLKGKNDAELLMGGAAERWKNILGRNKEKLAAELKQSKELMALIAKSRKEELSGEEKEKAKTQLKDLAKTIPSLTLFMLPGGSLLLPIILKIIPDLIPTAFRQNQIDEIDSSEEE